ncbi:type II toxin-antitoxin system RelE/ParE family toxin [Enterobacter hormaechei subsp. hoffmannii]|uniref:type II toxin-antitoxin system RelE family toxin n=1 Tax=Enterobacter hormaechei TaxID=158836 RepID=UPI001BE118F1|nr:type II toxin-antitoxin system RelE/ParE family toxin [Enterobacter hormaechei]MBT2055841.1 type II toxin-antitoxin system RelE/ParE family toxin [Enterobacter hormaechei subsp. hoffmannii]DAI86111.1 MAG TPA: Cytotoxic translational repressor [Bacteriophage sp.]
MTTIQWNGKATKDLLSLPSNDKKAISEKVNALKSYPDLTGLDVRKLTDQKGKYRLRVKNYRVLFEFINEEALVIEIQRILRRTSTTY